MSDLIKYIQNEFDAIWNTNNLEAVMDRFADDATVEPIPSLPGAPKRFVGKAQVRGFVQMLIGNFHVESKDFKQSGDKVMWYATVASDSIRQMGVESMSADCEATVKNGLITCFIPRFTADTMARLKAASEHA
jgi:ketosteroid isomerase-like protein